ncbi:MAG: dTDP-4-amino-4,6-dideoxygalactose transaminase [Bacteroidota bacterium]
MKTAQGSIPFNEPCIGQTEIDAVTRALEQGVLRGDGPISKRVEATLQKWLDVPHVFFTTSCTHALEMAMIALNIGPGDEVIMPSFTFVSSANAVVLRGAKPVFAEIDPNTLNIDPADIAKKITPATRAIVPVHYAGVACDMDAIMGLAKDHNLYVIEDAAQAIDATYKGKPLGTIGHIGCFSFHDTKNLTSGEGGAFVTNEHSIAEKAELVREKGTNRSAFFRGEVDKYNWVSQGSSYIQSDILAALLEAQIARKDEIKQQRKQVWDAYYAALQPLADAGQITLPVVPFYADTNYHIFFFKMPSLEIRQATLKAIKADGIQATFHYVPLHSSPYGRNTLGCTDDLPITEHCSETLIRLPMYPQLHVQAENLAVRIAKIVQKELAVSI